MDTEANGPRLGILAALLAELCLLCAPMDALAGPPLISDDPNTIGAGNVLPIISAAVFDQGGETIIRAPISDLTVGVVESLDFTLLTPFVSLRDPEVDQLYRSRSAFTPGLKWEFFKTKRGSLCLSPAFSVNASNLKDSFSLLPLEGELKVGARRRGVVGFDVGYEQQLNGTPGWFIAPYASYRVNPKLDLLIELWCLGIERTAATGGSIGIDAGAAKRDIRVLAAVGTGFVSLNAARVDVRVYVGVQYFFSRR